MTFDAIEQSVESADPVYLYLFTIGNDEYRYTSAAINHDAMGYTWVSAPLESDGIEITDKLKRDEFTVTLPMNHALSSLLMGYISVPVGLTVFSGYVSDVDGEFYQEWIGADCDIKPEGFKCKLIFSSIFKMSQSAASGPVYQRRCRHAIYSDGCGLAKEAVAVSAFIEGASGKTLTVPIAADASQGDYIGGMLKTPWGTFHYIHNHAGSTIELFEAVAQIESAAINGGWDKSWDNFFNGLGVILYPGCDQSLSRCRTLANQNNHGGLPWISDNPFDGNSIQR